MDDPLVLTVKETAAKLRCSVDVMYDEIRRGNIPSIRVGRKILVPATALEAFVANAGGGKPAA